MGLSYHCSRPKTRVPSVSHSPVAGNFEGWDAACIIKCCMATSIMCGRAASTRVHVPCMNALQHRKSAGCSTSSFGYTPCVLQFSSNWDALGVASCRLHACTMPAPSPCQLSHPEASWTRSFALHSTACYPCRSRLPHMLRQTRQFGLLRAVSHTLRVPPPRVRWHETKCVLCNTENLPGSSWRVGCTLRLLNASRVGPSCCVA